MRAAVLGHPIAHSLSPVLHGAAHRALELTDWTYEALDVTSEQLAGFLAGLDGSWAGLSLTMPLKQDVIASLDSISDLAAAVGAVNTLVLRPPAAPTPHRRPHRHGENTDVRGLVAAVREGGVERPTSAVVLGGGATAASAVAALAALGVREPAVLVRSPARAAALHGVAERLGARVDLRAWPVGGADALAALLAADVVMATAPAGATDALAGALADPAVPAPRGLLVDVVYAPRPTPLVAAWRSRSAAAQDGTVMLLHQAGEQVRLMTGQQPPLAAMRAALEAELARR